MWPFRTTPTARFQHRLLKRLRWAYLVTEDVTHRAYVKKNLHLLTLGFQAANDDRVLYPHWYGKPLNATHEAGLQLEERLWKVIGDTLTSLEEQGFNPDAFQQEARHLHDVATALQDVLQVELRRITHPDDQHDAANLDRIRAHIAHYLVAP